MYWFVWASFNFAIMIISVRFLSDSGINNSQIVMLRNISATVTLLPFLYYAGFSAKQLKLENNQIFLVRIIFGLMAMYCGYYAIANIELPKLTAIGYITPILMTIAAAIMLKEKVRLRRLTAIIIGFIGMLIIVRPGVVELEDAVLVQLLGCVFMAVAYILIKKMSAKEDAMAMLFNTNLYWLVFSIPLGIYYWESSLSSQQLFWILLVGLNSNIAQYSLVKAYKQIDVGLASALDFTKLIFVTVMAYIFLGQTIDEYAILGSIIILSASFYIAKRELYLNKIGGK